MRVKPIWIAVVAVLFSGIIGFQACSPVQYGRRPDATADHKPTLAYGDGDVYDGKPAGRYIAIDAGGGLCPSVESRLAPTQVIVVSDSSASLVVDRCETLPRPLPIDKNRLKSSPHNEMTFGFGGLHFELERPNRDQSGIGIRYLDSVCRGVGRSTSTGIEKLVDVLIRTNRGLVQGEPTLHTAEIVVGDPQASQGVNSRVGEVQVEARTEANGLSYLSADKAFALVGDSFGARAKFAATIDGEALEGVLDCGSDVRSINLLAATETFAESQWQRFTATTVLASGVKALPGLMDVTELLELPSTQPEHHSLKIILPTLAENLLYTASIYVKKRDAARGIGLVFRSKSGSYAHGWLNRLNDLSDVHVGENTVRVGAQEYPDGWVRFFSVFDSSAGDNADVSLQVRLIDQDAKDHFYSGSSGSGAYITGAQLEPGIAPLLYSPR